MLFNFREINKENNSLLQHFYSHAWSKVVPFLYSALKIKLIELRTLIKGGLITSCEISVVINIYLRKITPQLPPYIFFLELIPNYHRKLNQYNISPEFYLWRTLHSIITRCKKEVRPFFPYIDDTMFYSAQELIAFCKSLQHPLGLSVYYN